MPDLLIVEDEPTILEMSCFLFRCSMPRSDGVTLSLEWRDARWDKFVMAACSFPRRLKTLSGLIPYEYICKIRTSEPERFTLNPIPQMPALNT